MTYLSSQEIAERQPDPRPQDYRESIRQARQKITEAGYWQANQQMGRRWAAGCVALEITQRCNLDCSFCYLSEHSEAMKDLPLSEIYRRIDEILHYYGPNTDVQVTGGDPTLRQESELLAIVSRIRDKGLRPTLMTNGIKARRPLLEKLAQAGLCDIAFHVDTTQDRLQPGRERTYSSEVALNSVRQEYIERCRGLPFSVFFNTTVHEGNVHEVPALVRFFVDNADRVRTVSFQLGADTGRGTERDRGLAVDQASVWRQIEDTAGTRINPRGFMAGHSDCNRYGMTVVAGGQAVDVFDSTELAGQLMAAGEGFVAHRDNRWLTTKEVARWVLKHPGLTLRLAGKALDRLWRIKAGLWQNRGRASTLSFLIHDFMDADCLDCQRIDSCAFKTMTADGPVSMCLMNARRDSFLARDQQLFTEVQPLKLVDPDSYPLKHTKGRTRARKLTQKQEASYTG
ncbi:MAG: radical SAM protein [Endozoicomonas sp.]